jgi:D-alanyl-D-alanine carboxypeptidase
MNRTLLAIVLVSCSLSCSESVTEVGLEPTLAQRLQQTLDSGLTASGGKGISAAVVMPDGEVWTGVSGISEPGVPITPHMLFDMGSAGKNLFAALVLDLVEDGLVSLDDSLQEYLPPLPHTDGTITLRQCLNHTSGLYMEVEHPDSPFRQPYDSIDFEKWWTIDEIFTTLMEDPYFRPGESWHYTQAGYQLGTLIVKQVTGSTVPEQIQSRLLDPLNIHGMLLDLSEPIPSRYDIAHNWVDTDGDGTAEDVAARSRNWINSLSRILFYTTAEDFARWLHGLMEGAVLGQASLDEMLTFVFPTPGEPMLAGYGLGILEPAPGLLHEERMWGHSGSIPGYRAIAMYLPKYRVTVSMLMNFDGDEEEISFFGELISVLLDHVSNGD